MVKLYNMEVLLLMPPLLAGGSGPLEKLNLLYWVPLMIRESGRIPAGVAYGALGII